MKSALLSFLFFFLCLQAAASVAQAPPPPIPGHCARMMVAMLPCRPHLEAAPPQPGNFLFPAPADDCCAAFSAAIGGADAACLCLLARGSAVAGFPIDTSRLLSLPSSCGKLSDPYADAFFAKTCRGYKDPEPSKAKLPLLHEWHQIFDRYIWIVVMIYSYYHPTVLVFLSP